MRNAGDGAIPGGRAPGSSGRRHAGEDEPSPPAGGTSLFTPAYRASYASQTGGQPGQDAGARAGGGEPGYGDSGFSSPASGGYSWTEEGSGGSAGEYDQAGYDQPGYGGPGWP